MRIAYLDCFSGISGDMFLGALVDAGVPFELLQKTVADLNIGATLELSRVDRGGISATKLDVIVNGEKDMPREEFWAAQHHSQARARAFARASPRTHAPARPRSLSEILHIIAAAADQRARQADGRATSFARWARPRPRSTTSASRRFTSTKSARPMRLSTSCAPPSAPRRWASSGSSASPLNVGGGTVACAHGSLASPRAGDAGIAEGVPIYSGEIQKELVTPTGAAIVKVLVIELRAASR